MTRRARIFWMAAVLFNLVNLFGVIWAVLAGEPLHTGIHAVLLVVGVGVQRGLARSGERAEAPY